MKRTILTRFGTVEYAPEHLLHFPAGLIGFEDLHDFLVMPNLKAGPLFWIQSVEDPAIALVLTDPTQFFPDYRIGAGPSERRLLGAAAEDECFTLAVVTVPPDRRITLNLAAPVFFAPKHNRGCQVILDRSPFSTRTPLPLPEGDGACRAPAAGSGADSPKISAAAGR